MPCLDHGPNSRCERCDPGGWKPVSPYLNMPVRDRKQAAFDLAMKVLGEVERHSYEKATVEYVRKQIARISEILGEG